MAVRTETAAILFRKLAEKMGLKKLNHGSFGMIIDNIDDEDVTQKYLDDTYRKILRAQEKEEEMVGLRVSNLDHVARIVGADDFYHFERQLSRTVDKALMNYKGLWWSYVRANEGEYILKAPVSVYYDKGMGMYMKLRGEQNVFIGKVQLLAGCLFCELDSPDHKKLYIVMKGSTNEKFSVLQGTFAGISSASQPIAGREIWVREEKLGFGEMKWERISVSIESIIDHRIQIYFSDPKTNCIKIDKVSTFTFDDLTIE